MQRLPETPRESAYGAELELEGKESDQAGDERGSERKRWKEWEKTRDALRETG